MIELSIAELLYLVLTFFCIVLGTLLTIILIRILKILHVAVELTEYYYVLKGYMQRGLEIPQMIQEKISAYMQEQAEKNHKE